MAVDVVRWTRNLVFRNPQGGPRTARRRLCLSVEPVHRRAPQLAIGSWYRLEKACSQRTSQGSKTWADEEPPNDGGAGQGGPYRRAEDTKDPGPGTRATEWRRALGRYKACSTGSNVPP